LLSLSPHPGEEAVNNTLPSAFHHPALRFFAGAGSPLPYLFNPVFCSMLPHSIIFIISCTCGRRMTSNVTWPSPSSCLVDDDSHGAPTHHHLTPLGHLRPGVLFIFIFIVCVLHGLDARLAFLGWVLGRLGKTFIIIGSGREEHTVHTHTFTIIVISIGVFSFGFALERKRRIPRPDSGLLDLASRQ